MSVPPDAGNPHLQALLERSGVLQATHVIADLHDELKRDESTFESILKTISDDPPLAQRVIDISNSAWFGGRIKADTVPIAFGRLGVADFYKVVVAAVLRFHVGQSEQPEFKRWWAQSETTARLGEMLAQHLDPKLIESSFFIGLLHDCAVPLMARHVPDYSYLVDEALGPSAEALAMEAECNPFTHCDVGAALVAAWKFPTIYAEVVRHHHGQTVDVIADADDVGRRLLAVLLLAKRVELWARRETAAEFSGAGESGLEMEIANAFRITRTQLSETLTEMLRLFRLRQKH